MFYIIFALAVLACLAKRPSCSKVSIVEQKDMPKGVWWRVRGITEKDGYRYVKLEEIFADWPVRKLTCRLDPNEWERISYAQLFGRNTLAFRRTFQDDIVLE